MGKNSLYYLIARDRKTDQISTIYLYDKRGLSLEEIDIFTTSFDDSDELKEYLKKERHISFDDVDFFIASQNRFNGETYLNKYELLYSADKFISDIAENSLNKRISDSDKQIDRLLDYFAGQVYKRPSLYELLITGRTDVYEKYAKYFAYTNYPTLSKIKYLDGGWARTSYPLIRNVAEAVNSVEINYDRLSDRMHRNLIENDLIRVTDPSFDPNQLSLFDMVPDVERSYEDDIKHSVSVLENIPQGVFVDTKDGYRFNNELISSGDSWDLYCLETFMPEELMYHANLHAIYRDKMRSSKYPQSNSYVGPIEREQSDIINYLKENKCFVTEIAAWCRAYKKYEDKVLGDKNDGGYQKRKEQ